MPHALLLSPDDQAVSAITAVLEEMSVTCERPLDGVSAAKKLNSNNFDLVLVDCENLPAAKLIFDVCRRGSGGHSPVPIAIVDGRAGLPTAFRLGAELILTKPVAKDQARTTVRTAVSRVKKDEPARPVPAETTSTPALEVSADTPSTATLLTSYQSTNELATSPSQEARAMAAAAPEQILSSKESVPMAASSLTAAASMAAAAAPVEIKSASVRNYESEGEPKFESPEALGEDPVLAELEKAESEPPATPAAAPVFSAYAETPKEQKKLRGPLIAVLALALICAVFYAAWITQPGFRAIAQPQINAVLALAGMSHNSPAPAALPTTAKTMAPPASPPGTTTENNQTAQSGADGSSSNGVAATSGATTSASASTMPAPATATSSVPAASSAGPDTSAAVNKITAQNASEAKTAGSAALAQPVVPAPNEQTAIILSSKGAEKRLIHSVQPTYPSGSSGTEGTIVLQAMVDENGKVADAKVVEGNPALADAAVRAVKQWKYRPYLRDGKAVPFQTVVLIDFQRQ